MSESHQPTRSFTLEPGQPARLASAGHAAASIGDARLAFAGVVYGVAGEDLSRLGARAQARKLLEAFLARPDGFFEAVDGQCAIAVAAAGRAQCFRSRLSPVAVYFSPRMASDRLVPVYRASGAPERDPEYFLGFLNDSTSLRYDSMLTPFRGIRRLAPGELVTYEGGEAKVSVVSPPPRYFYRDAPAGDPREAAEAVRHHLERAVEARLPEDGQPVVCELSGGLDSSFVTALVARRTGNLSAYMYTFPKFPSHRFSEECARAVAGELGVRLTVLDLTGMPSADLGRAQPYRDEPTDLFWQGALFAPATREQLPEGATLFGGFGADQLFMRDPIVMPWLLRQGRLGEVLPMLGDCARSLDRSRAHLLWQSLLLLLPASAYRAASRLFARARFNPFALEEMEPNALLLESVPWLQAPGAARAAVEGVGAEETLREGRARLEFSYLVSPGLNTDPYYEARGVRAAHPFCDSRLIDHVFNDVSWRLIHDWRNPYKQLLREAQRGLVPEQVRARKDNEFFFNGFLAQVLRDNQELLRGMIADMQSLEGVTLSRDGMSRALDEMLFGLSNNSGAKLLNVIGYELWWRDFQAAARGPGNELAPRPSPGSTEDLRA